MESILLNLFTATFVNAVQDHTFKNALIEDVCHMAFSMPCNAVVETGLTFCEGKLWME